MEGNVWKLSRGFALVAVIGLSLSTYSTAVQKQKPLTSSYDVPKSDAASISTSRNTSVSERNVLRISRNDLKKSAGMEESRVGVLAYEGQFLAYTLEHESLKIPTGTYEGELRWSTRFEETVVYIHVPSRSGIEIHRGNCPVDSGGCVLVGTRVDGACLGNSRQALQRIVKALPQKFTVVVE